MKLIKANEAFIEAAALMDGKTLDGKQTRYVKEWAGKTFYVIGYVSEGLPEAEIAQADIEIRHRIANEQQKYGA